MGLAGTFYIFCCQVSTGYCLPKIITRNSAITDKPHNVFRDQSRSPNMVPFHMLGMVSY